jgi:hypothetical protein
MGIYRITGIVLIIGGVGLALFGIASRALGTGDAAPVPLVTPIFMAAIGLMLLLWHRREAERTD